MNNDSTNNDVKMNYIRKEENRLLNGDKNIYDKMPVRYRGEEDVECVDEEYGFTYYATPAHVTERLIRTLTDGVKFDPRMPVHNVIRNYIHDWDEAKAEKELQKNAPHSDNKTNENS